MLCKEETQFQPWKTHHSFQAEMYVIRACAVETIDRSYEKRNVYIQSYSPAKIEALDSYQIGCNRMGFGK
jgi:hypothetical protein